MNVPTRFDYGALQIKKRAVAKLERRAEAIERSQEKVRRTTVEEVFRIGKLLQEAHDELANCKNGTFGKWCKERLGITPQTARNMMRAVNELGNCKTVLQYFDPTACYLLSAESTPIDATEEAIKRSQEGHKITAKLAKEIIAKHVRDDFEFEEVEDEEPSIAELTMDIMRAVQPYLQKVDGDKRRELVDGIVAELQGKHVVINLAYKRA